MTSNWNGRVHNIANQFKVYNILDYDETQLLAMQNPFSLIVLAAQKALIADKIPENELAEHRLIIAKALIESEVFVRKIKNEK